MEPIVKKKKLFDARTRIIIALNGIFFMVIVGYLWQIDHHRGTERVKPQPSWTADKMRVYANKLKADGLAEQAAVAYEDYLAADAVTAEERAHIYYAVGEMLFKAKQYEEALSYFYKTEIANPAFDLKSELGSYIVACLENSGRELDAEYQLESRASLQTEKRDTYSGGEVVARIGTRNITMGELNAEIEQLPSWLGEGYKQDATKKLALLQHMVATELLYEKGKKLGLDKSPEVRAQVEKIQKQIVTAKVIDEEIQSTITADADDVENYYEAHKDHYMTNERVKIKHILTKTKDEADAVLSRLSGGEDFAAVAKELSCDAATKDTGGVIVSWLMKDTPSPVFDHDTAAQEALFALDENEPAHLIKSPRGFHVVVITSKESARQKSFAEVAEAVKAQYQSEKEMRQTQELLQKLMMSNDVEIYTDKFKPHGHNADDTAEHITSDKEPAS